MVLMKRALPRTMTVTRTMAWGESLPHRRHYRAIPRGGDPVGVEEKMPQWMVRIWVNGMFWTVLRTIWNNGATPSNTAKKIGCLGRCKGRSITVGDGT